MSSHETNFDGNVIHLAGLIRIWKFEQQQLLERSGATHNGTAQNITNAVLEHPEILAPLSMVLAVGVGSVGGLISPLVNRRNNEAGTRFRVLTQIAKLNGTPYSQLSWSNTLEIDHYIGWLTEELSDRVAKLSEIDLSLCEDDETKRITSQLAEYDVVVDEMVQFRASTELERKAYEQRALEADEIRREQDREIHSGYKLQKDSIYKRLANVDAKKAALLLTHTEANRQRLSLEQKLKQIQIAECCTLVGCTELITVNSAYCKRHKCNEIGCENHVSSVLKDLPLFLSKTLRGAASVLSNANTSHIVDLADQFCDAHGPTLNIDENYVAPSIKSPKASVNIEGQEIKTGLSANQKFCVVLAVILIALPILIFFWP